MSNPKEETRPFIRIYTKYRRILINLATHDILGKPPHFEFFWNDENKFLFIVGLWDINMGCYPVSPRIYQNRKNEIVLQERTFFNGLMKKLSWQNNMVYKVYGDFIPTYNMIGFHMANPIILEQVKI